MAHTFADHGVTEAEELDDLLEKFESVLAGRATIPDITDDDINDDEEEEEEDSADKIIPTTIPLMDIDLDEDDNT